MLSTLAEMAKYLQCVHVSNSLNNNVNAILQILRPEQGLTLHYNNELGKHKEETVITVGNRHTRSRRLRKLNVTENFRVTRGSEDVDGKQSTSDTER